MTTWPILSAYSDPVVSDPALLEQLAAIDPNVAAGVCANPNLPEAALLRIVPNIPLTADRATVVGRYAVPRLHPVAQIDLLTKAASKSVTAVQSVVKHMTDAALLLALTDGRRRANQRDVNRSLRAEVVNRAVHGRYADDMPVADELAEALTHHPHRWEVAGYEFAVVAAWQDRDPQRMTAILEQAPGTIHEFPVSATLGVPGLADQWFALGGRFRAAALGNPDLDQDLVERWLATADPVTECTALTTLAANAWVPTTALAALMGRLSALRWPADGSTPARQMVSAISSIGNVVDWRLEKAPFVLDEPVHDVSDTGRLTQLLEQLSDEAVLFGLARNPHLTRNQAHMVVSTIQTTTLAPVTQRQVLERANALLDGEDERGRAALVRQLELRRVLRPAGSPAPSWRQARATHLQKVQPTRRGERVPVVWERLSSVERCGDVVVHTDAPRLNTELEDAAAWAAFLNAARDNPQSGEQGVEAALRTARAGAAERTRATSMVALIGNALGDDDD